MGGEGRGNPKDIPNRFICAYFKLSQFLTRQFESYIKDKNDYFTLQKSITFLREVRIKLFTTINYLGPREAWPDGHNAFISYPHKESIISPDVLIGFKHDRFHH